MCKAQSHSQGGAVGAQGEEHSVGQAVWLGVHVFGWEHQEQMAPSGGCAERGMAQGFLQKREDIAETNKETLTSKGDEEKESLGQGEGWKRRSLFKLMEKLPLTSPEPLGNRCHPGKDQKGEVASLPRVYLAARAVCAQDT